jgi:hypothetical protein
MLPVTASREVTTTRDLAILQVAVIAAALECEDVQGSGRGRNELMQEKHATFRPGNSRTA